MILEFLEVIKQYCTRLDNSSKQLIQPFFSVKTQRGLVSSWTCRLIHKPCIMCSGEAGLKVRKLASFAPRHVLMGVFKQRGSDLRYLISTLKKTVSSISERSLPSTIHPQVFGKAARKYDVLGSISMLHHFSPVECGGLTELFQSC